MQSQLTHKVSLKTMLALMQQFYCPNGQVYTFWCEKNGSTQGSVK